MQPGHEGRARARERGFNPPLDCMIALLDVTFRKESAVSPAVTSLTTAIVKERLCCQPLPREQATGAQVEDQELPNANGIGNGLWKVRVRVCGGGGTLHVQL